VVATAACICFLRAWDLAVANKCDVCFYVLQLAGGAYVLLLLYVNDIILAATTAALAKHYVDIISKRF
jgi:hypothetical protein